MRYKCLTISWSKFSDILLNTYEKEYYHSPLNLNKLSKAGKIEVELEFMYTYHDGCCCCCCCVTSVVSDFVRPHRGSPPGSAIPGIPGKNTGVGCHFLLQCMKIKSESEVAQLCPTLSDPMDCSPPDSSIHVIFQAKVLEWVTIAFSDIS